MGISIPIVFFPGIVANLADMELVYLAISSVKLTIFDTFIPDAGSNSFRVTTGPQLILLILPSTPKSSKIFSKNSEFLFNSILLLFFVFLRSGFFSKKFIDGNLNLFTVIFVSLFVLKGKICCLSLRILSDESFISMYKFVLSIFVLLFFFLSNRTITFFIIK